MRAPDSAPDRPRDLIGVPDRAIRNGLARRWVSWPSLPGSAYPGQWSPGPAPAQAASQPRPRSRGLRTKPRIEPRAPRLGSPGFPGWCEELEHRRVSRPGFPIGAGYFNNQWGRRVRRAMGVPGWGAGLGPGLGPKSGGCPGLGIPGWGAVPGRRAMGVPGWGERRRAAGFGYNSAPGREAGRRHQ